MPRQLTAVPKTHESAGWAAGALAAGVAGATLGGHFGVQTVLLGILALVMAVAILRVPESGLLFILAVIPLDVSGRIITQPVTITWFHVALILTLVSWVLAWRRGTHSPLWATGPVDAGVLLLVVAAVWSLPGSLAPESTVIAIMRMVFIAVFYFATVALARNEKVVDRVVLVLVVSAVASTFLALAQFFVPGITTGNVHMQAVDSSYYLTRASAFFDDANYFATFLSVAIVAALAKAIHARRVLDSLPWLAAAILCGGGIVGTYSRTGWVGVAVGLVVLLLSAPRARRPALYAMVVVAVMGAALFAPAAVTSRIASIFDSQGDGSIKTRYLMVESTMEMIGDKWVFGTGLGAFDHAYPRYRMAGAAVNIVRPHQLPLAVWAEMGIPALVSELLIIGGLMWVISRRRRGPWSVYRTIGVAGALMIFVQSFFQYYLYFEYLWLCVALVVAETRFEEPNKEVCA